MNVIRDIMQTDVVAVSPETTLADAASLLTARGVDSAFVVGVAGRICGVVTELDLIDVVFDAESRKAPVANYMSPQTVTVAPDDALTTVAQMFALNICGRLPVVDNGRLVGIVTPRHLIKYALEANITLREPLVDLIPALAPMS